MGTHGLSRIPCWSVNVFLLIYYLQVTTARPYATTTVQWGTEGPALGIGLAKVGYKPQTYTSGGKRYLWKHAFDSPIYQTISAHVDESQMLNCRIIKVPCHLYSYAVYRKYLYDPFKQMEIKSGANVTFATLPGDGNQLGIYVTGRWNETLPSGDYQCCIERAGADHYAPLSLIALPPVPTDEQLLQTRLLDAQDSEEEAVMAEDLESNFPGHSTGERENLAIQCHHNTACMSAVLHARVAEQSHCLVCQHMSVPWIVMPLHRTDLTHHNLTISMCQVIGQTNNCSAPDDNGPPKMMLHVSHIRGETCACSLTRTKDVGWSRCNDYITVTDDGTTCKYGTTFNCTLTRPEGTRNVPWVCGDRAYGQLPRDWMGCCFAGVVIPKSMTFSLQAAEQPASAPRRMRRSLQTTRYGQYHLIDPFTSVGGTVGWSLLPGIGTAITLMKINGLAYELMVTVNDSWCCWGPNA